MLRQNSVSVFIYKDFCCVTTYKLQLLLIEGLMELPISQLQKPPRESRLLREADSTFIHRLKEKMIKDPSGPGAAPIAVLCKNVSKPEDFQDKYKIVYKYEVLGGLHTYIAKAQLSQEFPNNTDFQSVRAEVYVGLTDEAALRLALRHNQNSHFTHKVTHRDLVSNHN